MITSKLNELYSQATQAICSHIYKILFTYLPKYSFLLTVFSLFITFHDYILEIRKFTLFYCFSIYPSTVKRLSKICKSKKLTFMETKKTSSKDFIISTLVSWQQLFTICPSHFIYCCYLVQIFCTYCTIVSFQWYNKHFINIVGWGNWDLASSSGNYVVNQGYNSRFAGYAHTRFFYDIYNKYLSEFSSRNRN